MNGVEPVFRVIGVLLRQHRLRLELLIQGVEPLIEQGAQDLVGTVGAGDGVHCLPSGIGQGEGLQPSGRGDGVHHGGVILGRGGRCGRPQLVHIGAAGEQYRDQQQHRPEQVTFHRRHLTGRSWRSASPGPGPSSGGTSRGRGGRRCSGRRRRCAPPRHGGATGR